MTNLLSLDVAGAFDTFSHQGLIHNLRANRIPELIVNWTGSFLAERETSVTLGSRISAVELVKSVFLRHSKYRRFSCLFSNEPLIEECLKAKLKLQFGGFIDDMMTATVDLGTVATKRKASMQKQGLHMDGKVCWGPHIREVRARMTSQCLTLTMTAAFS